MHTRHGRDPARKKKEKKYRKKKGKASSRRRVLKIRGKPLRVLKIRGKCGPLTKCIGRNISETDSISRAAGLIYAIVPACFRGTRGYARTNTCAGHPHACRQLPAVSHTREQRARTSKRARKKTRHRVSNKGSVPVAAQRTANGNANAECFHGIPGSPRCTEAPRT